MEKINQALIDWNPWHEGQFPSDLYGIPRNLSLAEYLKFKEIKVIEGARRVGKSTLLYQVIHEVLKKTDKILYVNFDDEILKNYTLSEIYNSFMEVKQIDYLFLDEIQNCKGWVSFVRKMYDTGKLKQIYITGSNSGFIKRDFANLLTGRTIYLRIKPLNFMEFLNFKGVKPEPLSTQKKALIKKQFKNYMKEGGFPEVAKRSYQKKEILNNYFEDFLYKDIVTRYNVNAEKIKELTIYLASSIGKPISYRKLAKALNINNLTVQDYISYLKEIHLLKEIYRYDSSLKKQYAAKKKPYFLDPGLASAISFRFSEDKGRVLENMVFNSIEDAYFYEGKHECDFLLKKELEITRAIQVCYELNEDNREREINGLIEACRQHKLKKGLLLTYDQEESFQKEGIKITVYPVWKWMMKK